MDDHDARLRLALALDVSDLHAAQRLIELTRPHVGVFKVGLELFTAVGPAAIDAVRAAGARCFLDLKLHDIPATMGRSVARAAAAGVEYLTIHAASGSEAMRTANESAGATRLLAVTILTSLDDSSASAIGFSDGTSSSASRLAKLAWGAGIRGFVSSGHECAALRSDLGEDAYVVTPGIRPAGETLDDQRRVMTPSAAIAAGSDLLVVGRPIRDADDPGEAARAISLEVASALGR